MRRLMAMAMAVAVLVLAGCQPAPTVTITATAPKKAICGKDFVIEGKLTPRRSTPSVVLQRKEGGAWVDWEWWDYYSSDPGLSGWIVAYPDNENGSYWMQPRVPLVPGRTYAFRVRSAGRSVVSPTFYVKVVAPSSGKCPTSLWEILPA